MRRVSSGGVRVRRVVVHGGEGVAVAPVVVRVREGHHVLLADGHESVGEEVRVWKQNRNAYDESPQIYCPTFSSPNFHSLSATAGGKQRMTSGEQNANAPCFCIGKFPRPSRSILHSGCERRREREYRITSCGLSLNLNGVLMNTPAVFLYT